MEDRNGDFSDVYWNLIGVQTTQTCQSNSASNFLWSLLFENEDEGLKLFWYYDLVPGLFIFNASHTTLSRCGSHKRRWKIGPISDACPPITFKALIVNKGFENTWTLLKTWVGGGKSEVKSEVRPVPPGRYGRIIWTRHRLAYGLRHIRSSMIVSCAAFSLSCEVPWFVINWRQGHRANPADHWTLSVSRL